MLLRRVLAGLLAAAPCFAAAQPVAVFDIADADETEIFRGYGYTGNGTFGVPVGGGADIDGDGHNDMAVSFMTGDPLGRNQAGIVSLILGDGTISGSVDTGVADPRVIQIYGSRTGEVTGSEVWFADVTGDGIGDVIIGRQNAGSLCMNPPPGFATLTNRVAEGAVTVLVGGPEIRTFAEAMQPLDLANPPAELTILTIEGDEECGRLGFWPRTGDVDGDGIDDIIAAADLASTTASLSGEGWVIRGGAHLDQNTTVDLSDQEGTLLEGNAARIILPPGPNGSFLGSTTQAGDIDGDGKMEVLLSAATNRSGASLDATGNRFAPASGGESGGGSAYVVWGENFPEAPWPLNFTVDMNEPATVFTRINGDVPLNGSFGEELLGGFDWDNDGNGDLFVGDLVADPLGRNTAGSGHVFYNATLLKGMDIDLDTDPLPPGVSMTTMYGPVAGAIGGDTVAAGDYNGDGIDDLLTGNPKDNPEGRTAAGSVHILYGQNGQWPETIDLADGNLPPPEDVRIALIIGALGSAGSNIGDTICYSAAYGDVDGDGLTDVITNEMLGNGLQPGSENVGNLIVISGKTLLQAPDDFFQIQ